jgi:transketolase
VDGHSFPALEETFSWIPFEIGKPNVVLAQTVRGRGLPSMENRADRWLHCLTEAEAIEALAELETARQIEVVPTMVATAALAE